ncbi:MAG: hypothetical protein IPL90_07380 [Holophagales bacterium]|nr:hypothetical protein [Holophagales bacterium]
MFQSPPAGLYEMSGRTPYPSTTIMVPARAIGDRPHAGELVARELGCRRRSGIADVDPSRAVAGLQDALSLDALDVLGRTLRRTFDWAATGLAAARAIARTTNDVRTSLRAGLCIGISLEG